MTRHAELEHTPDLGVLARAAGTIADPQVRTAERSAARSLTAIPRPTCRR